MKRLVVVSTGALLLAAGYLLLSNNSSSADGSEARPELGPNTNVPARVGNQLPPSTVEPVPSEAPAPQLDAERSLEARRLHEHVKRLRILAIDANGRARLWHPIEGELGWFAPGDNYRGLVMRELSSEHWVARHEELGTWKIPVPPLAPSVVVEANEREGGETSSPGTGRERVRNRTGRGNPRNR